MPQYQIQLISISKGTSRSSLVSEDSDALCHPLLPHTALVIYNVYTHEVRTRSFALISGFFHHPVSDILETCSPSPYLFFDVPLSGSIRHYVKPTPTWTTGRKTIPKRQDFTFCTINFSQEVFYIENIGRILLEIPYDRGTPIMYLIWVSKTPTSDWEHCYSVQTET